MRAALAAHPRCLSFTSVACPSPQARLHHWEQAVRDARHTKPHHSLAAGRLLQVVHLAQALALACSVAGMAAAEAEEGGQKLRGGDGRRSVRELQRRASGAAAARLSALGIWSRRGHPRHPTAAPSLPASSWRPSRRRVPALNNLPVEQETGQGKPRSVPVLRSTDSSCHSRSLRRSPQSYY